MRDPEVFSLDEALASIENDWGLFQTMAELFFEQGPKDVAALQAAAAAYDAAGVARAAHRLKGAVMQFCAPTLLAAARALEEAGTTGKMERVREDAAALAAELDRLLAALRRALARAGLA